jgi:hypothetical protein
VTPDEKGALIHRGLERAADALGDITAPVYALYYDRCPEALAKFIEHRPHGRERLEGEMVEQALYCLMEWFSSPGEIEIVLITTIPHHIETLGVSCELFAKLITAVHDIVTETIPPDAGDERAVWRELHAELIGLCEESARNAVM